MSIVLNWAAVVALFGALATQPEPITWPEHTAVPEDSVSGVFGPGVYLVGEDIEAGTYRTLEPVVLDGPFVSCFWRVAPDNRFNPKTTIAHNAVTGGFSIVTVVDGNYLDVRECGEWARIDPSTLFANEDAHPAISEGTWLVGEDIAPGTYRTDEEITMEGYLGACYWTIAANVENNFLDIIEEDSAKEGNPTVTLEAGQQFTTFGCGNWSPTALASPVATSHQVSESPRVWWRV